MFNGKVRGLVLSGFSTIVVALGACSGGGQISNVVPGSGGGTGTGTGGDNGGGGSTGDDAAPDLPIDEPPITIKVMVTPPTASLAAGATAQYAATVMGAGNDGVTWTTSGGTISNTGLYTAPAIGGSYIVTARSVEDPRAYGNAHAEVTGSTLSQPDPIRDHTISPAIYVRWPVQGMQFLAPGTVTILADCWDPEAPTMVDFMDGTAVVATVSNAGVSGGSGAGYFLRGVAKNLAAGTHELWVRETSKGGATHDSAHLTVTVVDPPAYSDTVTLTADMAVTGDVSWVGTADKPILIQGNGHRITSADTWTGKLTIKNAHIRDLGADPSGLPTGNAIGMKVNTSGDIDVEGTLFEHCGEIILNSRTTGGVTFRGNTLNENTAVSVDATSNYYGTNYLAMVAFGGDSSAAKVFAGNRVAMGWAEFNNTYNWTIGGNSDADANIIMGARGGMLIKGGKAGVSNTLIRGNFTQTLCSNRWTQCTNILFDSPGSNIILEHNILLGGWNIRPFKGEARYNVIVAGGEAFMQGWAAGASLHHNIINNLGLRAPGFDSNIWDLYTATAKGIEIYNNTWDAGGTNLALYGPAIRVRSGAVLKSVRNNAFVHFPYYLAPVVSGDRDVETKSPPAAIADYMDYNAFYNPEHKTAAPMSYYAKTTTGAAAGTPGFGGHDVGGMNMDVDPKFAGPADQNAPESKGMFPFSAADVWARKVTHSLMLQRFANYYRPEAGSPLTDAGDPADGVGTDVGAIDSGMINTKWKQVDAFGK